MTDDSIAKFETRTPGLPHRTRREIARRQESTNHDVVRSASIAREQIAKLNALTQVGRNALHDAAGISELQDVLDRVVPAGAIGRNTALADVVCLGLVDIIQTTVYRLSQ